VKASKTSEPFQEPNMLTTANAHRFQLRFRSLFDSGRGFAFPCDDQGQVDLDDLSEHARNNYFYARAMVGRELAVPAVEASALH
jgi:hypothetical protein